MDEFRAGYDFFEKNAGSFYAANQGINIGNNYIDKNDYINLINQRIDELENNINSFKGTGKDISTLKGDVAEFFASGTFNINAAKQRSSDITYVNRSTELGSVDISSNFGENYGLKVYKTGTDSAKQQSKSIFEAYKSSHPKITLEEYLDKHGYTNDDLNNPIYAEQIRIIPKDQIDEAKKWLEEKIKSEAAKRSEQVYRYEETLKLLRSKIDNGNGVESVEFTKEEMEHITRLAKEGGFDASKFGFAKEVPVTYKFILQESFKAGMSAAVISIVLQTAPEIIKALKYLISNGEIDANQLKKIGFAALNGASEGFIRGSVSAAITAYCKSGLLGEAMKNIDPSLVGAVVVIAINTLKNTFDVVAGKMTNQELAEELIKQTFISACSLGLGYLSQLLLSEAPVLGFLLGNFVGSILGSFVYSHGYKAVISFCVDTGFTMFGLVDQNYELPTDIMKQIGINVFEYDKFEYPKFEYDKFEYPKFQYNKFEYDKINITFLRRGVIGVNKIGYI